MGEISAEQLTQRAHQCHLLETHEIDRAVSEAGGRGCSFEDLRRVFYEKELLTNWQIQRLVEGHRKGFFYGDWRVLYMVGAGTFARVYRGSHRKTGDIKAIKVLRNRYSTDLETRDRFLKEARVVMKLRHPNIVPIHEVDDDRGRTYMVMDFIEGQNLRDYVRAHKKINVPRALKIIRDLASGLDYAFNVNILHRDMKLSNVLLSTGGQAKIVDFGLAAVNQLENDDGSTQEFTPRSIDYAGLERVTNVRRDDTRSDVYFLGCILYHMLSGKAPLFETRERIKRLSPQRYKEVVPISNHEPGLPHRVVILVNRMMDLDPTKRPQTPGLAVREIDATLEAIESGESRVYDENLQRQTAEEYAQRMHKEVEGQNKTIMVVESNIKVQDALREKLKDLGYRVLIIGDPQRAITRFMELDPAEDRPADCVIFGCAGLGRTGIDAFNTFAENEDTREAAAILLVTENLKKHLPDALLSENRVALDLPLKFKRVRVALRRLLGIPDPDESPAV